MGAAQPPVLTVTLNPVIDLNLEVEDWGRTEFSRALASRRAAGGKGVNVSRVLSELNVASTAAVVVGGPDAQVFLSLLAGAGFEVAPFHVAEPTRTNVVLSARRRPHQVKINQAGPHISAQEWRAIEAWITALMPGRRWVVLSGALPPGLPARAYARLVKAARRHGCRVALDCEGESLRLGLKEKPDLIKPNRDELSRTLGRPCRTRQAALDAARAMMDSGASTVVVSHGSGTCMAVNHQGRWEATPPAIELGSPVGCGDSMVAGLIAGLDARLDTSDGAETLGEALRLSVACGAACAQAPDTVLARRAAIKRLSPKVILKPIS